MVSTLSNQHSTSTSATKIKGTDISVLRYIDCGKRNRDINYRKFINAVISSELIISVKKPPQTGMIR